LQPIQLLNGNQNAIQCEHAAKSLGLQNGAFIVSNKDETRTGGQLHSLQAQKLYMNRVLQMMQKNMMMKKQQNQQQQQQQLLKLKLHKPHKKQVSAISKAFLEESNGSPDSSFGAELLPAFEALQQAQEDADAMSPQCKKLQGWQTSFESQQAGKHMVSDVPAQFTVIFKGVLKKIMEADVQEGQCLKLALSKKLWESDNANVVLFCEYAQSAIHPVINSTHRVEFGVHEASLCAMQMQNEAGRSAYAFIHSFLCQQASKLQCQCGNEDVRERRRQSN
jgi:hypothetical protein